MCVTSENNKVIQMSLSRHTTMVEYKSVFDKSSKYANVACQSCLESFLIDQSTQCPEKHLFGMSEWKSGTLMQFLKTMNCDDNRRGAYCRRSDTELLRKIGRTRNWVKAKNMIHCLRGFSSNACFLHCMQLFSVEESCNGCRVGRKL